MKIKEQVLSIEQMKHLQELGVDTSDASMFWIRYDVGGVVKQYVEINDVKWREWSRATPYLTYTIGDIIEKLPKEVDDNRLEICLADKTIGYVHFGVCAYHEDYDNLIDGLYDCLCWLAENHKELL